MKKTGVLCLWLGILSLSITSPADAAWKKQEPLPTPWYPGGQDQTVDDVPGSIWKRSGSAFMPIEGSDAPRVIESGVWPAPPLSSYSHNKI
jgi:hypothetical protein